MRFKIKLLMTNSILRFLRFIIFVFTLIFFIFKSEIILAQKHSPSEVSVLTSLNSPTAYFKTHGACNELFFRSNYSEFLFENFQIEHEQQKLDPNFKALQITFLNFREKLLAQRSSEDLLMNSFKYERLSFFGRMDNIPDETLENALKRYRGIQLDFSKNHKIKKPTQDMPDAIRGYQVRGENVLPFLENLVYNTKIIDSWTSKEIKSQGKVFSLSLGLSLLGIALHELSPEISNLVFSLISESGPMGLNFSKKAVSDFFSLMGEIEFAVPTATGVIPYLLDNRLNFKKGPPRIEAYRVDSTYTNEVLDLIQHLKNSDEDNSNLLFMFSTGIRIDNGLFNMLLQKEIKKETIEEYCFKKLESPFYCIADHWRRLNDMANFWGVSIKEAKKRYEKEIKEDRFYHKYNQFLHQATLDVLVNFVLNEQTGDFEPVASVLIRYFSHEKMKNDWSKYNRSNSGGGGKGVREWGFGQEGLEVN